MTDQKNTLIDKLPKAELHLHIEGTLEPEMMLALAKRNDIALPYDSVEEIRAAYEFDGLQDFLDLYYAGMSVLIEERDFYDLTWAYLETVADQGVTHVEIFFDPQAHTDRGIAFETVLGGITSALETGARELRITSRLIMCFLRHLPEEQAFDALHSACRHKDHIHAVGLDSSEAGIPPSNFARVYEAARNEGFITVAHAGEEGPAAYVTDALDILKVSRVDHGNHALDDPALVARLVREKTPLTMCPLSNLRLKVIASMEANPVKTALDAGLLVTVNSDDPSYFGGYINANYEAVTDALDLSITDIVTLAKNSFAASFLPDEEKQTHIDAVERHAGKFMRSAD
ncbi:MAG: adenosine deaminase [Rhodospirillaceae bacterium]|jgi:adenosine deaminase|nr:adenosine deaminase [Rhodospirillaceae bacterium]MBT3931477.1 adenosine deaminase [Rhodospirillaceae bacterium]MBT4773823.1 adenosine deaminase [Rhodospirillaceae bacterium]MBT5357390.1 adenosine deaminase [Rhodospirillaceae bacterium]MBT5770401.1 adenosine deaminase [Rhodospirillaceae bacterium]